MINSILTAKNLIFSGSDKIPKDWCVFTILFIVLPQIVDFLAQFFGQNWPSFTFKDLKQCNFKPKFNQILGFKWWEVVTSLPMFHIGKRFFWILNMTKANDESMASTLQNLEKAKLCNVLFHSGPQIILQLTIILRRNHYFEFQLCSIALHFVYIVVATPSFYFTQRPHPSYIGFALKKIPLYFVFGLILIVRMVSMATMFSYAKTFITVAFIVFFGIALMALYYDQHVPQNSTSTPQTSKTSQQFSNFEQLLFTLMPVYVPCIKGLTPSFHLTTTLASVGMHFMSHIILMVNVLYLQTLSIEYFPHFLHCFSDEQKKAYDGGFKDFDLCHKTQFFGQPYNRFILWSVGIMLLLIIEVVLNFLLNPLWKKVLNTSSLKNQS